MPPVSLQVKCVAPPRKHVDVAVVDFAGSWTAGGPVMRASQTTSRGSLNTMAMRR